MTKHFDDDDLDELFRRDLAKDTEMWAAPSRGTLRRRSVWRRFAPQIATAGIVAVAAAAALVAIAVHNTGSPSTVPAGHGTPTPSASPTGLPAPPLQTSTTWSMSGAVSGDAQQLQASCTSNAGMRQTTFIGTFNGAAFQATIGVADDGQTTHVRTTEGQFAAPTVVIDPISGTITQTVTASAATVVASSDGQTGALRAQFTSNGTIDVNASWVCTAPSLAPTESPTPLATPSPTPKPTLVVAGYPSVTRARDLVVTVDMGSFTDTTPGLGRGDFQVSIDYGDGHTGQGGVAPLTTPCTGSCFGVLTGINTYAQPGQYTATVTIVGDDGTRGSFTTLMEITP